MAALLNGHIIRNPATAKISAPYQALNPSPVPDQTVVSSSIPIGEAAATTPPIDPNIVPDLCSRGNSTCPDVKSTSSTIATPTLTSESPNLGSSRLTENGAEHGYIPEAANSNEPNGGEDVTQNENGDDATQNANENDAYQGNVHTNDSVPIDEHAASDKINVDSNMDADKQSKTAQETGATTTGASHQTSTLDNSSDNDNDKIWIPIVISTAMGVLVIVIAVLGLALYRTLKQMDEHEEPIFKCNAYAPLV
jgi:hypothetical protein